jgi:hypothetical protein
MCALELSDAFLPADAYLDIFDSESDSAGDLRHYGRFLC